MVRVPVSAIYYIEKEKNYLIFHTAHGSYKVRGTIAVQEERVAGMGFAKCNSGCIVNLAHVTGIFRESIRVRETEIPIARQHRKLFHELLMNYIRDGVNP